MNWKGEEKNYGEGAGTVEKGKTEENRKRTDGKKWSPQSTCS
jgi:hypothetical protein